jgi:hypothetical protein
MTSIIPRLDDLEPHGKALDAIDAERTAAYAAGMHPLRGTLRGINAEHEMRRAVYYGLSRANWLEEQRANPQPPRMGRFELLELYAQWDAALQRRLAIQRAAPELRTEREFIDAQCIEEALAARYALGATRYHKRIAEERAERVANKSGKTTRPRKRRSVMIDGERVRLEMA